MRPGDLVRVARGCIAIHTGDPVSSPEDLRQFGVVEDDRVLLILEVEVRVHANDSFIRVLCDDGMTGWIRPGVVSL